MKQEENKCFNDYVWEYSKTVIKCEFGRLEEIILMGKIIIRGQQPPREYRKCRKFYGQKPKIN